MLLFALFSPLTILNSTVSWLLQLRQCLTSTAPTTSLKSMRLNRASLFIILSCVSIKKLSSLHWRNLDCLISVIVAFLALPANTRIIKVTHDDQSLQTHSFFKLSEEVIYICLMRESVADTHTVLSILVTHYPEPQTLMWHIIHPKLLSHIKGSSPSSHSWPFLLNEPPSIHCSTPDVESILDFFH